MSYNLTNLRIRIEDFLSKGSKIDRSDLHHLINNIDTNVRQEIVVSYDDIKQSVYNLCEVIFIHSEKPLDNCLRLAFNFMDSTAQIETLNQRLDSMKKRYGIAGGRINRPFTGPDRIRRLEEASEKLTKEGPIIEEKKSIYNSIRDGCVSTLTDILNDFLIKYSGLAKQNEMLLLSISREEEWKKWGKENTLNELYNKICSDKAKKDREERLLDEGKKLIITSPTITQHTPGAVASYEGKKQQALPQLNPQDEKKILREILRQNDAWRKYIGVTVMNLEGELEDTQRREDIKKKLVESVGIEKILPYYRI